MPLLLGLTAVIGTLGLLGPISQIVPMDESLDSVVLLIGLAVGVDYSMFYLRRKMEERDAGRSREAALEFAAATSGRAVLVSGLTVMIAMAGMFLAGNAVFTSLRASARSSSSRSPMLGSRHRPPRGALQARRQASRRAACRSSAALRHRNHGESRVWGWILDRVLAPPGRLGGRSPAACCVVLALPALSMHTINPGVAGLPRDLPIMQTYDRIQAAFPGGPLPAVVVVQADDVTAPEVQQGIEELQATALATGQMSEPVTIDVSPDKTGRDRLASRCRATAPTTRSDAALAKLRDDVIPATIGRVAGTEANVTGMTAGSKDFNDTMNGAPADRVRVRARPRVPAAARHVPLIVDPAEGDRAEPAVGRRRLRHPHARLPGRPLRGPARLPARSAAITSWLPLFLFVILFGLSMDYHVFILSRIREAVDGGMSTDEAVAHGIKADGGRRDQRGGRDGRGVRDLRHAEHDRVQADGRRPRRRRSCSTRRSCARSCSRRR